MANYKIFETNQFMKDLEQDFGGQQKRIHFKLLTQVYPQLRESPYFGRNIKKLRDWKPETWRYRIGDFRFFYEINEKDKIVYMIAAHARKDSY